MIEQALQRLAEHPRGLAIVIILSFGVGLVLVLPLADEYSALHDQSEKLVADLAAADLERQQIPQFEKRARLQQEELAALEARAVSDERATEFRNRLVLLVRETGCSVRQIGLSDARKRDWYTEDDPLLSTPQSGDKAKPTGFELKSRVLSLAVSGPPERVRALLAALHAEQPLAYTRSLSLRPENTDRQEIVMELEIWLFDLATKPPAAA